jgi:F0F1-type ATP synthase assembly protein I
MGQDDELERIRKIRDRQLQLRDPTIEEKRLQREIAKKRRSRVEKFSFGGIFGDIPKMITGTLIGMVIGILIFVILPYIFPQKPWVDIAGVAVTVIGAIFGFFFGRAIDARDALSDF